MGPAEPNSDGRIEGKSETTTQEALSTTHTPAALGIDGQLPDVVNGYTVRQDPPHLNREIQGPRSTATRPGVRGQWSWGEDLGVIAVH
jgi:hypothetical protein